MKSKEQILEDKLVDEIELRLVQNIANHALRSGIEKEAERMMEYLKKVRSYRQKLQSRRIVDAAYRDAKASLEERRFYGGD